MRFTQKEVVKMEYKPHNYQAYCINRIVNDPAVGLFLRPG